MLENLEDPRDYKIFRLVVEHYLRTGQPVGSRVLATKFRKKMGEASIRYKMRDLIELGLLTREREDAPSMPSKLGLQAYMDEALHPEPLSGYEQDVFKNISPRAPAQVFGAVVSTLSDCASVVSINTQNEHTSWHGVSRIAARVEDISPAKAFIDAIQDRTADGRSAFTIPTPANDKPRVYVGRKDTPFPHEGLSIIVTRAAKGNKTACIGLVGPDRQNYGYNIALLTGAAQALTRALR